MKQHHVTEYYLELQGSIKPLQTDQHRRQAHVLSDRHLLEHQAT